MERTIPVTAPFSEALDARARIEAAKLKISRAELVRQAVEAFLKHLEQQPAAQRAAKLERAL